MTNQRFKIVCENNFLEPTRINNARKSKHRQSKLSANHSSMSVPPNHDSAAALYIKTIADPVSSQCQRLFFSLRFGWEAARTFQLDRMVAPLLLPLDTSSSAPRALVWRCGGGDRVTTQANLLHR
jgi:hypothetical protein